MTEAKPKHNWFRFSLRTLLLLITVFAVWLGFTVSAARRQREAVSAIFSAGGRVSYDFGKFPRRGKMDEINPRPRPTIAPDWLRERLGDDFCSNVVSVGFDQKNVQASTLRQLSQCSELATLQINRMPAPFEASHLEALTELTGLRELCLNGQGIDGEAVGMLVNLKQLRILRILAFIDDVGMEQLGKLKSVQYLTLTGNSVTDDGFSHLQHLTNLDTLELQSFFITQRSLLSLKGLTKLRVLDMLNCRDRGGAIEGLKQLKQLSELQLREARLSPEVLEELKSALPNTKITAS